MRKVQIWTDGACSGNPGPGAAAALLMYNGTSKEVVHICNTQTTNSRMEMMAVIIGLEALKEKCEIEIYSDSNLIVQGINTWIHNWSAKGWRKSDGKKVENQDLWLKILVLMGGHEVKAIKVSGHSGNMFNERVNDLAQSRCPKVVNA